jgi:hypothetical protein
MNYFVCLSIFSLGISIAKAQHVDTIYAFQPALYKRIAKASAFDTIFHGNTVVALKRDSSDRKVLKCSILLKGEEKQYGQYVLHDSVVAYNYYFSKRGDYEKVPFRITYHYVRQGYWRYNGKPKDIYYIDGKELKIKN